MSAALLLALFACDNADPNDTNAASNPNGNLVAEDTDSAEADSQDTAVVDPSELVGDATIWPVCGPTDGDALMLSVAQQDAECAIDGTDPRNAHPIALYLWAPPPTSFPATITLGDDAAAGGTGSYSPTPSGPTYLATSGSVTFTAFTADVGAQGTWELTLVDGTTLHGAFDAAWCANEPVCR